MVREILDIRKSKERSYYLVACMWCGKEKWIQVTDYNKNKYLFCSHACFNNQRWDDDLELQNYEYRRSHNDGSLEIKTYCSLCGIEFWVLYRVFLKDGWGKFCSRSCARLGSPIAIKDGFENGRFLWVPSKSMWMYSYRDNKKRRNISGARALWIINYGDVPNGMYVLNSNPNSSYISIDDLYLEKHQWYTHGFGYFPYSSEFSPELKAFIKERDGWHCVICSSDETLHVHHIDGNKDNNSYNNFVTLCSSCHHKVHHEKSPSNLEICVFQNLLEY